MSTRPEVPCPTVTAVRVLGRKQRSQRGMTLLEIMIVLAIIGLLMGVLVGPRIFRALSSSKKDAGTEVVRQFHQAYPEWQKAHDSDPNQCPEDLGQQLIKEKFVNWRKVTTSGEVKDPWNTPLKFTCPGTEDKEYIDVESAGPDRKWDTGDDIKSWKI